MLVSVFTVMLYYCHDILQTEQGDSKPKLAVTEITVSACCSLNLNAKITVNILAHIVDLRDLFDHLFFLRFANVVVFAVVHFLAHYPTNCRSEINSQK